MHAALRLSLGLLASLALVVALAVLLTPPVHALLVDLGLVGEEAFAKVLRRLLLIPLLVLLFLWLRPWRDGGPRSYGLLGPGARWGLGLATFGLTVLVALGILACHFAASWLRWEEPFQAAAALARAGRWLAAALGLSLLEEWFFRGWLDRRIGRRWGPAATAAAVAGLYGALHAFKPSRFDFEPGHDAAGAWSVLCAWFEHLADLEAFGTTFVGLFLLSLLLTRLWRRTGSLWPGVGVHAGGVWVLRSYGAFTDRWPERTWAGTKELLDGPPVWALLGLLLLARARPRPCARSLEPREAP